VNRIRDKRQHKIHFLLLSSTKATAAAINSHGSIEVMLDVALVSNELGMEVADTNWP
jgi:hypothetical protein